ncbi:MAG TPA: efflux RND transporter periplasmic adaptor subunit [Balneolaceae bacterium]|nr:efflux RND transporter periplasmic adaptor subunit [Balneolaceae bacterium]
MTNQTLAIKSILSFSVLLLLSSCSHKKSNTTKNAEKPVVQTSVAKRTSVPRYYQFVGSVESEHRINLSTKVTGQITSLPYDVGDSVSKGKVLLQIKHNDILAQRNQVKASLAQAQTTLENTRTNYNRIKALYADSSVTKKKLDDMRTQFEVARARIKALKSKLAKTKDLLDYSILKSPINGYIVKKNVTQGDMTAPGKPLLTLEDVKYLKVHVTVPSSQIGFFSKGDSVNIAINAADAHVVGTVKSINPSGNAMSRQFDVDVRIPPKVVTKSNIKPGMFARISLKRGSQSLFSVPAKALIHQGQLTGLYMLDSNNKVILQWVRTGRKIGSRVQILSGLAKGDRYITSYNGRLQEGQKVTIQ